MEEKKIIYKIIFYNQGDVYELYAHKISQSNLYAFIEIEDLIFGERSKVLVDPSEEKLKSEFSAVNRRYIPMQAIIRIDEVTKEGANKIHKKSNTDNKVTPFPFNITPPNNNPGGKS
mgnify:CR=1 FL=1